ncbi:MAG TPA: glutamyl-tRNA reductase [Tepidisphaeraceae bacterium]|jgi:glutamyl-tRNA reductase|nr:glutamyl-tRNA reductase [Tepidisphaeraceae bacterium]
MQRLLLLGLNHTTAPLEVREKLAFNAGQRDRALASFLGRFPGCEAVLLSTCNRVELYIARQTHGQPREDEMLDFLADFHQTPAAAFKDHLYYKSNRDVVDHLFTVTASLDSMVLGETQILGQVRDAYEAACKIKVAGGQLNPLFQRAIAVGKQVMHDTTLNEGRLSVASVAVDYAKSIFDHFGDKTILSIGAGKMSQLVLRHFVQLSPGELLVCNRDATRADALAAEFNGRSVPFENLADHLVAADIVVSSTGSMQPIITRALFDKLRRQRRNRRIFLIDIAVPRDIEPGVGEFDNVYLYNLDDLQQVVTQNQSLRKEAVNAARKIVDQHVEEFAAAQRQRELGPAIHRLYTRYHQIALDEAARTLKKFPNVGPAEKAHLDDLARRIVNKLLHDPVQILRESGNIHTPAAQYLHALEKLFQLGGEAGDGAGTAKDNPPEDQLPRP